MTESDLLAAILDLAKLYGFRSAHFRPAMNAKGHWRTPVAGEGKGWPDLVLVKPPRVIVAELKSDTGRLSPEQEVWLALLRDLPGVECYVWRPGDLPAIAQLLGARIAA